MQIITLNLNGVRAANRKGVFEWLSTQRADIVCVQELKAQILDLSDEIRAPNGFHGFFHCAEKKVIAAWVFIVDRSLTVSSKV